MNFAEDVDASRSGDEPPGPSCTKARLPPSRSGPLLHLQTWEDYVGVALDETIAISDSSLQVRRRVDRLLTELVAIAPPGRRESLQARLDRP